MWNSMGLSTVGIAALWSSVVSTAAAQGYVPPAPYGTPYSTAPQVAPPPFASSYYPGTTSVPAVSGGYAVNGNPTNGYVATGAGPAAGVGPFWAPGGYEPRMGSPYLYHDPNGGQFVNTGNPYYDHFGPGFHRAQLYGHYRFPYYNYRAPWYYPGRAVYNRDTNLHW